MSLLLTYITLLNAASFIAFGMDKRAAIRRQWRISEATLLSLAFIGGALGAIAGQRTFRHKTQKQPFKSLLYICAAVNAGLVLCLFSEDLRGQIIEGLRQSFGL